MKATGMVVPLSILVAAGLAVGLILERDAARKLDAENDALRGELSKMGELTAENQRLANLLDEANARRQRPNGATETNSATDGPGAELARLRSQVAALHQQTNEVESVRSDTRATHNALDAAHKAARASALARRLGPGALSSLPLEVLEAGYGTDHTNLDVAAELNDRIREGHLKMVADNNLAGDPEFGIVKSLTVVYRFGETVFTNHFREGDSVVLPPEGP